MRRTPHGPIACWAPRSRVLIIASHCLIYPQKLPKPISTPKRRFFMKSCTPSGRLSLLVAEDIGVTSVEDGHGRAAEELTASSAELNL